MPCTDSRIQFRMFRFISANIYQFEHESNTNSNLLGLTNKTIYHRPLLALPLVVSISIHLILLIPFQNISIFSSFFLFTTSPHSFSKYLNFITCLLPLHASLRFFLIPFHNISIFYTCLLPPPPQTSLLPPTAPNMSEL